jgi:hypothetical protein
MLCEDMFYQYRAGLIDKERHESDLRADEHTGKQARLPRCVAGLQGRRGEGIPVFRGASFLGVELQPQRDMTDVWRTLIADVQRPGNGVE